MTMRITETMVTFRHPFVLAALKAKQPAGAYRVGTMTSWFTSTPFPTSPSSFIPPSGTS